VGTSALASANSESSIGGARGDRQGAATLYHWPVERPGARLPYCRPEPRQLHGYLRTRHRHRDALWRGHAEREGWGPRAPARSISRFPPRNPSGSFTPHTSAASVRPSISASLSQPGRHRL